MSAVDSYNCRNQEKIETVPIITIYSSVDLFVNPAISTIPSLTAGLIMWDKRYSWIIRQTINKVLCVPSWFCFHARSVLRCEMSFQKSLIVCFLSFCGEHRIHALIDTIWTIDECYLGNDSRPKRFTCPNNNLDHIRHTRGYVHLGGLITPHSCFTSVLKNIFCLTDR